MACSARLPLTALCVSVAMLCVACGGSGDAAPSPAAAHMRDGRQIRAWPSRVLRWRQRRGEAEGQHGEAEETWEWAEEGEGGRKGGAGGCGGVWLAAE
jgi:hypothetical protein